MRASVALDPAGRLADSGACPGGAVVEGAGEHGLYTVVASPSGPTTPYPQLAVTVAIVPLFASLAALIFFLDHLAHSIQIDRLMAGIEHATIRVIKQEPPGVGPGSGPGPAPAPPVWAVTIPARRHGYVQTVHPERLLLLAEQLEVTVLIAPLAGEHVVAGRPIAYAWRTSLEQPPPDPAALAGPIQDAVVIGYQRTLQQDVRFGMRQLVDIALRALSPAVNDPYTAIQAIHRLTVLLCALGRASRVIVHAPAFADYAELACSLIRRYGAAEPTVSAALTTHPAARRPPAGAGPGRPPSGRRHVALRRTVPFLPQGRVHRCTSPPVREPSATMRSPGARVGWAALTSRKMVVRSLRSPEPVTCQVKTVSRAAVLGYVSGRSITTLRARPAGVKPTA